MQKKENDALPKADPEAKQAPYQIARRAEMNSESLFKPPFSKALKAGKVILQPGESIGEHVTEKREEAIIVLRGTATLLLEGKTIQLSQGQALYIGPEKKHDVKNNSSQELEYVYVVALLE